ncbi:MAG TPA: cell division protein FtsZ, partial [Methanomassiliicoccales archaeon]|nr:cell division protein FtsZ [Methanomassiliicoccales archaeon]
MTSSLVKNALANTKYANNTNGKAEPAKQEPVPAEPAPKSNIDEELEKIAAQLDVCIKIIGCGGGGCNTINRCWEANINGAQLCAINTDAKHLLTVKAPRKILIGKTATRGLGAGAKPEMGEAAARESDSEIRDFLNGSNIVFVTAGLGGGTGTGAAHYVARIAKEQVRALTIGVVTMPFKAEG